MVSHFPLALSTPEALPRKFAVEIYLDSCSGLSAITKKCLKQFTDYFEVAPTAYTNSVVSFQVANGTICHSDRQVSLALQISTSTDHLKFTMQSFAIVDDLPAPVLLSCFDCTRTTLLQQWMSQFQCDEKVTTKHGPATLVSCALRRDAQHPLRNLRIDPPRMQPPKT
jgi:hypothetical protein